MYASSYITGHLKIIGDVICRRTLGSSKVNRYMMFDDVIVVSSSLVTAIRPLTGAYTGDFTDIDGNITSIYGVDRYEKDVDLGELGISGEF